MCNVVMSHKLGTQHKYMGSDLVHIVYTRAYATDIEEFLRASTLDMPSFFWNSDYAMHGCMAVVY